MKFSDLNLQAYDEERKQWCIILEINVDSNRVWMSNGCVRFGRDLDKTELRSFEDKSGKRFYIGDLVEVVVGYATGRIGIITKNDCDNSVNNVKLEFDNCYVGWYNRDSIKVIKRNRRKDRILA